MSSLGAVMQDLPTMEIPPHPPGADCLETTSDLDWLSPSELTTQSQSHAMTDGQYASHSWCQAPFGAQAQLQFYMSAFCTDICQQFGSLWISTIYSFTCNSCIYV
jgi:hypothetical protein